MEENRLQKILKIVGDSPVRLRETYFINNYQELYSNIISFSLNISDLPFIQKLWHWVENKPYYFACLCGKKTTFHKNWRNGYREFCSQKCSSNSQSTKEKRKLTSLEKWGVDNVSKSDLVKKKQEETNLKRWGYKSSFQNPEVQNKYKETSLEKWGVDHFFKTEDFRIKTKKYYLQKWGVDHQLKIEEVKEKIKETCQIKYGVEKYLNTKHSRESIKSYNRSKYEDQISEFLTQNGINHNTSERDLINPLLLDIFISEFNLAIEFNGLYWHSEFKKEKEYHLNKKKLCNQKGIHLLHIWEDDWKNRKEVIKSIILNRCNLSEKKIYSRKCAIKEITNREIISNFLNKNHIQGYSNYSTAIGLIYSDELVSLMTFGFRWINGKKEYELLRFCNKLNTQVIGSASKLFQYFIKNNLDIQSIKTYTDLSLFSGDVYSKMGFTFDKNSGINYWWVVNGLRKHRFGYNKKKLVSMGFDPLLTETQIMHSQNYYRIWGCGQDRWVWNRN
jgi:hypothetical protein